MRNCDISDAAAIYLAASLEVNKTLKIIYLQGNNIYIDVAKSIAKALKVEKYLFSEEKSEESTIRRSSRKKLKYEKLYAKNANGLVV